ncbi:MAG: RIO1 family regulatory kinase/ATPase domain-containing protein [Actinomycetota bacterium]
MRHEAFEHFYDEGLVERHLKPLKHGKEASVHLFRANPSTTGEELVALKLYHPLDRRDFRDETLYRDGEFIKERRTRVALEQRTKFGREVQGGLWVSREWETLRLLDGQVPVPRPIENTDDAILMSYVGDEDVPAPRLHEYHHDDLEELEGLWEQLHRAIVQMLYRDVVHADLSSYNILVWDGEIVIIDLPQAVDAKKNQHAQAFLTRDIERIGGFFERRGLHKPWDEIANDLWTGWLFADLVPEELRGLVIEEQV